MKTNHQNPLRSARFSGFTKYPSQFWLMIIGAFINSIGSSMIWPFILLFFRNQLGISMLQASSLLTIKAAASLLSSFIAGSLTDRLGRKNVMVFSLIASGLCYLLYLTGSSFSFYILLMILSGTVEPMYRVGSNAMTADLLPDIQRASGYAMLRMVVNVGLTIGPLLSGFLILKSSYGFMFTIAAACLIFYGLFILILFHETIQKNGQGSLASTQQPDGGYSVVFRDKPFIAFCVSFFFLMTCMAPVFITLIAYANENYAIPESQLSYLMTTNALIVIFLQFGVTKITEHQRPMLVMSAGALLYIIGTGSIALGSTLWAFIASMVVVSLGEITLMPTSTTYTANAAPFHLRGRYMSIYGIAQEAGIGLGPIIAGALNDFLFPKAIWFGCMVAGFISMLGFLLLSRRKKTTG
jgi:MFS family permease